MDNDPHFSFLTFEYQAIVYQLAKKSISENYASNSPENSFTTFQETEDTILFLAWE